MKLVFALLGCTGCLFVSAPVTKDTVLANHTVRDMTAPGALALAIDPQPSGPVVVATFERTCRERRIELVRRRVKQDVKIEVSALTVALAPLAPILVPASIFVSGAQATEGTVSNYQRVAASAEAACPAEAPEIAIRATLPDGTVVDGVTDAAGRFALPVIPQPGPIVASAQGAIAFLDHLPAGESWLASVYGTLHACGDRIGIRGVVTVALAVDEAGQLAAELSGPPEVARCVRAGLARTLRGAHAVTFAYRYSL